MHGPQEPYYSDFSLVGVGSFSESASLEIIPQSTACIVIPPNNLGSLESWPERVYFCHMGVTMTLYVRWPSVIC